MAIRPQTLFRDTAGLTCPDCTCDLTVRAVGDTPVSECATCGGLWVPDENFDLLVNRARAALAEGASIGLGPRRAERVAPFVSEVRYRKCPVCAGVMQRRNFGRTSGIIVDWCGRHGTWLDAHELQDIASFIEAGGLHDRRATVTGADADEITPAFEELRELKARAAGAEDLGPHPRRSGPVGPSGAEIKQSIVDLFKDILGL